LNIHPGESWAQNFVAIREKATAVKKRVAPEQPFGLGLRIAHQAAAELSADAALREEAREFFTAHDLYAFSINGFPYGRFHAGPVKENVYAPDWQTPERLAYTRQLADILAAWLPPGVDGSISTVPGSFKSWITSDADRELMARNLAECALHFARVEDETGREIHLGLEPEPSCFLETTPETLHFFRETLLPIGGAEIGRQNGCSREAAENLLRRHVGVCFDTCHVALQYEDPAASLHALRDAGIRISKVQISAALRTRSTPESWAALRPFAEPVYLHQVKGRGMHDVRYSAIDLAPALDELLRLPEIDELRVHFHVPLFFEGAGVLHSTSDTLTPEFFRALREGASPHLEIETYTFDVLPPEVRPPDVVESIAREYEWVRDRLRLSRRSMTVGHFRAKAARSPPPSPGDQRRS
jgi:sugar phosphate isomerase/epimerase